MKFDPSAYMQDILAEIPPYIVSTEEIADSAYGICKRIYGKDTALFLFGLPGFETAIIEKYRGER